MESETEAQDIVPVPAPVSDTEPIDDMQEDTDNANAPEPDPDCPDKTELSDTDLKDNSPKEGGMKGSASNIGNKSPSLTLGNSAAGGTTTEDCEMRNLEDYEPGSSSLTTPLSSSDLEQTPRSSSEADGGDGEKSEKSEKNETIDNNSTNNNLSANANNNNNGHVVNLSGTNISKRSVTLQMLLAAGILKPGDGTMSLEYHGQKFMGDLLESGQIRSQETSQEFSSPSAWATACKQIINPEKHSRKSGCGWASIKHRNLKLDYYKTVWFKRLREGSIDLKHISNGAASSSSSETEDDDSQFCVLKFGEHFEKNPSFLSAQQMGAKILISCTEFKALDRLQPFHVKVATEALAAADLHCNMTNSECFGYISGRWNSEQNCLKMDAVHPTRILLPHSSSVECDMERNRIAIEINKLGHDVVGWYHSHPKAPPYPTKDDVAKQLDYQVMMKGASESSYIPCIGVIVSPICYTSQEASKKSQIQLYWVLPPPENRPLEMGRPMKIDYEIFSDDNFNPSKLLSNIYGVLNFYKEQKSQIDLNDLTIGKFEKLKETLSSHLPELKGNETFWRDLKDLFAAPFSEPSPKVDSPDPKLPDDEPDLADPPGSSENGQNHAPSNASTADSSASSPEGPDMRGNSASPAPSSSHIAPASVSDANANEEEATSPVPKVEPESEPMEVE